ncbi:MAG: HAMP domain-containing histidine kinase, partial [Acidobacteria bacterium]
MSTNSHSKDSKSAKQELLSKVSRYEALFELTGVINAATDIESVGEVLARRLKYIVDVYSWRYLCFDSDPGEAEGPGPTAIVVDGYRGRADVTRTIPTALSRFEAQQWRDRKTRILSGDSMSDALEQLPKHFQKEDLEQISVNTLVEDGKTQALYLFCRRRQPFTELDIKCLAMVCGFFHRKVHMLWEQQKLRDLELAYLQQEVMLRQSERLATLGRLSAGMAHELNNPAAIAVQGAEQLRSAIPRLERARFALGAANLSTLQRDLVAKLELEQEAEARAKKPSALDPIAQGDLEEEVEKWLERNGIDDPWEHASTLVTMGLCAAELEDLTKSFDSTVTPVVVDYFSSKFEGYTLLEEIGHGARRVAEIVKALKGYSFMDRAPVQSVDVREGLDDTLVMLSSRLRDGITVDVDYAEDLPRIQGYGSELNQVWTNLIDNAIGAMEGKGRLELKTYQENSWVVVEVADTGPGIPIEEQDKVFDPFFTTKAPGEGTGLGLNISHGIVVEKHGGQISV